MQLTKLFLFLLTKLSRTSKNDSIDNSIKDSFKILDFNNIFSLISNSKYIKEEDSPFVFFILKNFLKKGKTEKLQPFVNNMEILLAASIENPLTISLLNVQSNYSKMLDSKELNDGNFFLADENELLAMFSQIGDTIIEDFLKKRFGKSFESKLFEKHTETGDIKEIIWHAKAGDRKSITQLTKYLYLNMDEAKNYIKDLEKINSSEAQAILGIIFSEGVGVEKNAEKGYKYFKKGGEKNNVKCLNGLGRFYSVTDKKKALGYFEKTKKVYSAEGTFYYRELFKELNGTLAEDAFVYTETTDFYPMQYDLVLKLMEEKRFNEALKYSQKLLFISPEFKEFEELAFKYFEQGKFLESFVISMFCAHCGHPESLKNLIFLYNKKIPSQLFYRRFKGNFFGSENEFLLNLDYTKLFYETIKMFETEESFVGLGHYHLNNKEFKLAEFYFTCAGIKTSTEGLFYKALLSISKYDLVNSFKRSLKMLKNINVNKQSFNFVYMVGYVLILKSFVVKWLENIINDDNVKLLGFSLKIFGSFFISRFLKRLFFNKFLKRRSS